MNSGAETAARLGRAGAVVQMVYGLLAVVFPHPRITERPFEVVWALAVAGMIATVVAWLRADAGRPRMLGLVGGGLTIVGCSIRIVVALYGLARPEAAVDLPIVISIAFMFIGLALLGIAALRSRQRTGGQRWAPLIVLAGGLVAAPLYDPAPVAHFIVLGLVWGATWFLMASAAEVAARERSEGVTS
ncbi:hypothetical protein [Aeromicrobium sp.]|uniref:hypothetical protein n=1 Tax=Aeromicrobium sp. TaxID=1871063 RepID=UPI003C63129F